MRPTTKPITVMDSPHHSKSAIATGLWWSDAPNHGGFKDGTWLIDETDHTFYWVGRKRGTADDGRYYLIDTWNAQPSATAA